MTAVPTFPQNLTFIQPEDSEQWHVLREAFSHMPPGAKTCFQRCLDLVVNHDNTTCQVHREEIDTLLVFVRSNASTRTGRDI